MRPPRVGEVGPGGADALGDRFEGVRLADDALFELVLELQDGLDLVADHLADGMPVQPETTSATACRRRPGRRAAFSPCTVGEFVARASPVRPSASAASVLAVGAVLLELASRSSRIFVDELLLLLELLLERRRAAPRRRPCAFLRSAQRARRGRVPTSASRARGSRSRRRGARSRGCSPRAPAGVADWLSATRAQAVSSRLTALSGSWRSVM